MKDNMEWLYTSVEVMAAMNMTVHLHFHTQKLI